MAESWPLLKPETLTDQVYEVLRERVISGTISPGKFIRENDVSERLGVSRTPVREALARLASEGFLERIPHRGFRLPEKTIDDLVEIYPIMTALEVLGTREAFDRLDGESIAELRDINDAYSKAFQQNDVYGGIDNNHAFHDSLSSRSGNKHLCRMLEELRSRVRSLEVWAFADVDNWQKSIDDHEKILDALEEGKLDQAVTILEINRMSTLREYIKKVEDTGDAG